MRNIRQLLVAFLMSAVVACGGGGTLGESGTPTTPSYSIGLALTDASGVPATGLSKANPLKLKATVKATNGSAANKLVTFTINDPELASFNNGAGTAQTLADGTAEIGLLVGSKSGAGEISASIDGGTPVKIAFTSAGDSGAIGSFQIVLSLVDSTTGTPRSLLTKDVSLNLKAVLTNSAGQIQPDQLVTFKVDDPKLAKLNNGSTTTARTDVTGTATLKVSVGENSGSGTFEATFTSSGATVTKSIGFESKVDGSIVLYADKLALGSGLLDKVGLTALVRDGSSNLLKDVDVSFSVPLSDETELEVIDTKTTVSGTAKANLTSRLVPDLRTVTVTASAVVAGETRTSTLKIEVVGTTIEVTSPQAVVLGGTATLNINLIDAAGNGIPGTKLTLKSKNGNTFDNPSPVTAASSGRVNVTYTANNGGADVITVTALKNITKSVPINVDLDEFAFTTVSPTPIEVELNTPKAMAVKWMSNRTPVIAKDVAFATTRGVMSKDIPGLSNIPSVSAVSQLTDNTGVATVYLSSEYAGFANLSAKSTGSSGAIETLQKIEFIATKPHKDKPVEVQVFPTKVGPGETSVVTAVVRDLKNNPVKNQIVSFSLSNAAGGKLNPATSVTNSLGIATTEFEADANTPGAGTPDVPQGLEVNAQLVNNADVSGKTTIVVGKRTLFYRFGTGNEIDKTEESLYRKQFAIVVTDAAGNPVANQRLNVQVYPKRYALGAWVKSPAVGAFVNWRPIRSTAASDESNEGLTCLNEDINRNGILDPNEDKNEDKELTPGNIAVAYGDTNGEASIVTSNNQGIALFNLQYPREYAAWVDVDLVVSSGNIVGTENITSREFTLSYAAADVSSEGSSPPPNPYGVASGSSAIEIAGLEYAFVNNLQGCH